MLEAASTSGRRALTEGDDEFRKPDAVTCAADNLVPAARREIAGCGPGTDAVFTARGNSRGRRHIGR